MEFVTFEDKSAFMKHVFSRCVSQRIASAHAELSVPFGGIVEEDFGVPTLTVKGSNV